jgi:hypothetical protein
MKLMTKGTASDFSNWVYEHIDIKGKRGRRNNKDYWQPDREQLEKVERGKFLHKEIERLRLWVQARQQEAKQGKLHPDKFVLVYADSSKDDDKKLFYASKVVA